VTIQTPSAAVLPLPDGSTLPAPLQVIEVRGVGLEAGRVYGEACRSLILQHLDIVASRLAERRGLSRDEIYSRAKPYREFTAREQPLLAAEIDGVAEGAGVPTEAAWVLQLRAELMRPSDRAAEHECTSFAVVGKASADGGTLAGQNADLPAFYSKLLVLVRRTLASGPALLNLTPAGQIGYHGMNEAGVAVFANFLHSDGWRVGVPRYLLTRIGLAERSTKAAVAAIEGTRRASPRNLMVADETWATNLETTVSSSARLELEDGLLAHSNHYVAPQLQNEERSDARGLHNSHTRLARMWSLLREQRGKLNAAAMARILRDREGVPNALCRASDEWSDSIITIASTIAEVSQRRLWIAIGPPHLAAYHAYTV
jgi:isopenicillin-N N-acyltransferase like protein